MADLERDDLHLPKSTFPSLSLFSFTSHPSASKKSAFTPSLLYIMHPKGGFLFAGYTRYTIPCFATTASHMGDICILRPYTYAFGTSRLAFYIHHGISLWALASEIWFASLFVAMQLFIFFSRLFAKMAALGSFSGSYWYGRVVWLVGYVLANINVISCFAWCCSVAHRYCLCL